MVDRIGGWNVTATSVGGLPAVAERPAEANKQHVVYGVSAQFSAAPAAPVALQIINPDVSPNTVYWQGLVPITNDLSEIFLAGICIETGASVAAVLSGNGSLVGKVNLHGNTR
jgi:hypothetical protein